MQARAAGQEGQLPLHYLWDNVTDGQNPQTHRIKSYLDARSAFARMEMLPEVQHNANSCAIVKGRPPWQLLLDRTLDSAQLQV